MRGTKPSLATCTTFWESLTPPKRRTATYIALAYLPLREGGTRMPRLKLINVPSVKGYKGSRNFRELCQREVRRIPLPRLSGKDLDGSDQAFLGNAKRRKVRYFTPLCSLVGPRNGPRSEFPDSLSTHSGE